MRGGDASAQDQREQVDEHGHPPACFAGHPRARSGVHEPREFAERQGAKLIFEKVPFVTKEMTVHDSIAVHVYFRSEHLHGLQISAADEIDERSGRELGDQ